jgi:hypothetical protein
MRHSRSLVSFAAILIYVMSAGIDAAGNDIEYTSLSQGTFNSLNDELATMVAYNPLAPAEPLGITGFDLGLSVSSYKIDDAVWNQAVRDGSAPSRLSLTRVMARKGLPFGIDIGASYGKAMDSNVSAVGGEVRKALLEGSTLTPAVSVSGHYSKLLGVDDLDLAAYGLDLGISKGFALLTPYAGVGQLWYDGHDRTSLNLRDRSSSQTHGYFGMRLGLLPFMGVTAQADFSEINSYSLRLDLGF